MFGWFKKDDGFEWHEYVRTTILVRRNARRKKIDEVREAAVKNIADAGKRGVSASASGMNAAGRGLLEMSSKGARFVGRNAYSSGRWLSKGIRRGWVEGSSAARKGAGFAVRHGGKALKQGGEKLGTAAGAAWRAGGRHGKKLGGALGKTLGGTLGDLVRPIVRPELALPVGVVSVAAVAGAIGEFLSNGFSPFAAGLAILGGLAAVFALACWSPSGVRDLAGRAGSGLSQFWHSFSWPGFGGASVARAGAAIGAMCLMGGLAAGAYWMSGPASDVFARLSTVTVGGSVEKVAGFAKSLSGDTLRIDGTMIKLAGIEAPLQDQRCTKSRGRNWKCGYSALQALRRVTGYHKVICELGGEELNGFRTGTCRIGDMDIAAQLVSEGHVFAQEDYFGSYKSHQAEAQAAKLGIWRGEATRPAVYRNKIWKTAAQKAPNGCPVKGSVLSSRGKVYFMPWTQKYDRFSIKARRGERWFCSEQEALDAGWKPYRSL